MQLRLDAAHFLAQHWQREALLLREGFHGFQPPADADELAGLALEPDVDARIIRGSGRHWERQCAPLTGGDLQHAGPWTLLVQAVDHYWDEAAALLDAVPFLPRWRLADVMMSYATDGGSAGPHYDQYDVFIIQGEGERRWQLGQACTADSPLLDAPGLRLLADFQPQAEYRLRCGDVLYIPPGVAHWGVSCGESTSFSIGLRAPRLADLLARWTDARLNELPADLLYGDAGRSPALRPGEFTGADLARAREQLRALLDDDDPRWFGEVITDVPGDSPPPSPLPAAGPLTIYPMPGRPIAWFSQGASLLCCAGGNSRPCPGELAPLIEALAAGQPLTLADGAVPPAQYGLLQWLLEQGCVDVADD